MCFLFDFDIKEIMQYIGIIASLVCAFYAFKTFEQAEKIAKIQDQKEKDKEANIRLKEIIKFLTRLSDEDNYPSNDDECNTETIELQLPEEKIKHILSKIKFDITEEKTKMIIIQILQKFVIYNNHEEIKPETAKIMNLDYDILEKIYNNIYLKQYAN